jgi:hypothetical protein
MAKGVAVGSWNVVGGFMARILAGGPDRLAARPDTVESRH